ncbi:Ubiquitin-conjugating enzyme E2 2 [Rhizophlyctis rosea]|nr:Ubiquitin-conjugating enzyme E2 2 [Rhizophlyctis rosea]
MLGATTTIVPLPASTRRLLRDLTELTTNPIDTNISAAPLPENIYEWHANLRNPDTGFLIHLVLVFPTTYPLNPPKLILTTYVPHENVVRTLEGPRVCLDMLEDGKVKPYEGWSGSYSVRSVLVQLQAFIFDPAMKFAADNEGMEEAFREAKLFKCKESCGHTFKKPQPAFPTEAEIRKAQEVRIVVRPLMGMNSSPNEGKAASGQSEAKAWSTTAWKQPAVRPVEVADAEGEWVEVVNKRRKKYGSPEPKSKPKAVVAKPIPPSPPKLTKPAKTMRIAPQIVSVSELQKLHIAPSPSAVPSTGKYPSNITRIDPAPKKPVDVSKSGHFGTIPYELLIHIISLPSLTPRDILSLSLVNRHLNAICQDGTLWRRLLQRRHPRSQLTASRMQDWKLAFALESNHAADEMRCFITKASWEEDVLGMPIVWTKNPKTGKVDYIACEAELISRAAFLEDKVRRTVWNAPFTDWLPVYISEDHFRRGLPDAQAFMVKMSSHRGSKVFAPDMVLEVIPKMMNTLIVLLCDHGMAVSARAVECYFLLHRLLMGFFDVYPILRTKIETQVATFIRSENNRTKEAMPSLGDFLPLLSFSSFSWVDPRVHNAVLDETADRAVLWMCRDHPELAKVSVVAKESVKVDLERLRKSWDSGKVSRRLLMFHCYALYMCRKSGGVTEQDLKDASDQLFGRPPKRVVDDFQTVVKRILAVDKWPDFYRACYVTPPSPQLLTAKLEQAVRNSLRKGYHKKGMDFSRVQSRGVSKILLRGESFSAPPNLQKIVMEEAWRYGTDTKFLDASVSVYDFQNKLLGGHITYCNQQSAETNNAIIHSGDVINYETKEGKHTVTIDIPSLPKTVRALVFCMSAWQCLLRDIRHPYVRLISAIEDVELCKYVFKGDVGTKKSILMCVLWRKEVGARWECKAVGELGDGDVAHIAPLETGMGAAIKKL